MVRWRIDDSRAVLARLVENEMELLSLSDDWFLDFERETGISPSSARMRMENFCFLAGLSNRLSHVADLDRRVYAEFVQEGQIPNLAG